MPFCVIIIIVKDAIPVNYAAATPEAINIF
jgi:hypothetical protein